jgi:hypothetical protein
MLALGLQFQLIFAALPCNIHSLNSAPQDPSQSHTTEPAMQRHHGGLVLKLAQAARQQQFYCQKQQHPRFLILRGTPAWWAAGAAPPAAAAGAAGAAAACAAGAAGFSTAASAARGLVQLRYLLGVGGILAASQFDAVAERAKLSGLALVRLGRDVAAAAAIVAGGYSSWGGFRIWFVERACRCFVWRCMCRTCFAVE